MSLVEILKEDNVNELSKVQHLLHSPFQGQSILDYCVQHEKTKIVTRLLEMKFHPTTTSLWHAICNGNIDMVKLLLQYKCPTGKIKGFSLMEHAIRKNKVEIAALLMEKEEIDSCMEIIMFHNHYILCKKLLTSLDDSHYEKVMELLDDCYAPACLMLVFEKWGTRMVPYWENCFERGDDLYCSTLLHNGLAIMVTEDMIEKAFRKGMGSTLCYWYWNGNPEWIIIRLKEKVGKVIWDEIREDLLTRKFSFEIVTLFASWGKWRWILWLLHHGYRAEVKRMKLWLWFGGPGDNLRHHAIRICSLPVIKLIHGLGGVFQYNDLNVIKLNDRTIRVLEYFLSLGYDLGRTNLLERALMSNHSIAMWLVKVMRPEIHHLKLAKIVGDRNLQLVILGAYCRSRRTFPIYKRQTRWQQILTSHLGNWELFEIAQNAGLVYRSRVSLGCQLALSMEYPQIYGKYNVKVGLNEETLLGYHVGEIPPTRRILEMCGDSFYIFDISDFRDQFRSNQTCLMNPYTKTPLKNQKVKLLYHQFMSMGYSLDFPTVHEVMTKKKENIVGDFVLECQELDPYLNEKNLALKEDILDEIEEWGVISIEVMKKLREGSVEELYLYLRMMMLYCREWRDQIVMIVRDFETNH